MAPATRFALAWLTAIAFVSSATGIPATNDTSFGPSEAAARHNAFAIFNAVHSAMRQWGSSLHHNGMSFFLATVPAGVMLHHGTHSPTPPPGPEWLAFEIEHAEAFARPRQNGGKVFPRPTSTPTPPLPAPAQQHPLIHPSQLPTPEDYNTSAHGYLHLYRTTAPLHLLYLDGTSAGNTVMGTLDSQDLLLRLTRNASLWDEWGRAAELCALVTSWGLHGVLRMEAGFEVVMCDFARDIELLAARQRPAPGGPGEKGRVATQMWEFVRAVVARYGGIGGGRVGVDWSGMVSALWYEVDLGNPEGRGEELPRLVGVGDGELREIRGRVEEVVRERLGGGRKAVDWQGVVDSVVARYADRVRDLAEAVEELEVMQGEVNGLLNTHVDYAEEDEGFEKAIQRCARHYTLDVETETQEDKLILTAVETVTHAICAALFEVRTLIVEDPDADDSSMKSAMVVLRNLMDKLRWTRWKECTGCAYNEVCFVPMWPLGDKTSHERPNCRNVSRIWEGWPESAYWIPSMDSIGPQPNATFRGEI